MSRTLRLAVIGLCSLAILAGCSKDSGSGSKATRPVADTPQKAVKNFADSFQKLDKEGLVGSVYAGEGNTEFIGATFDMVIGMQDLEKSLVSAYGKGMGKDNSMNGPFTPEQMAEIEKAEIKIDGDTATATIKSDKKPMPLIKKDGKWYVDMSKEMPTGKDREQALAAMGAMAGAIKNVRAKVGTPGYSAEKAKDDFGKEMMAAMMKNMKPS